MFDTDNLYLQTDTLNPVYNPNPFTGKWGYRNQLESADFLL